MSRPTPEIGSCMIPAPIMARSDLTMTQRALYGKVFSFTFHADRGLCDAGNEYLARQLDISPETVSNYVGELARMGLLERRVIRDDSGEVVKRVLRAVDPAKLNQRLIERTPSPSPLRDVDPSPLRDGIDVRVVTVETDVEGSSLRSSPPQREEDGTEDDTTDPPSDDASEPPDPLDWIHNTPASEKAPTAHWTDGVRRWWWGQDEDPFGHGVGATMRYLETARRSYGGSHTDTSRVIVGCHALRERGELMGLDPGESFGRGLLLKHDKGDGRLIWYRALNAARDLEEPDEREVASVLEAAGIERGGDREEEADRVPA